ncbi:MAG: nucleotidyltransferase family protein [Oscillospiraceae bacterium]|nr:nucleotidyltransferase family protein [Oscillospiraceae bacterium]
MSDYRTVTQNLLYLSGCAVNGIVPELELVESMNLEGVHSMSSFHSLTAISCMALECAYGGKLPETELFKKWAEEKDIAIYKNLLFDVEREQVLSFLNESGIRYMPLKGIILKDLYPNPEMRQMADNDILFDSAHRREVHDWFLSRGYRAESYNQGNHDAYHKKPVYNFEMHTSLFGSQQDPVWQKYYEDIRSRAIPDGDNSFGYYLSDEDFYVYFTAHSCKHHRAGGTGLRSLLDCYVYNKAKGDSMDWDYISGELRKLGISDFEEETRTLSQKIFSDPERFLETAFTDGESQMLFGFSSSGTYGTVHNNVQSKLQTMESGREVTLRTKIKYVWHRIFPDLSVFKDNYPFFYRHKFLLPVGCVYRLIYKGITNRHKLIAEAKSLGKN